MADKANGDMQPNAQQKSARHTITLNFGLNKYDQLLYQRLIGHTKAIRVFPSPSEHVLALIGTIYGTTPNPPEEWKDLPLICAFSDESERHIDELQYRIHNLQCSLKFTRSSLKEARARLRQTRSRTDPGKRVRGGGRCRVVRAV